MRAQFCSKSIAALFLVSFILLGCYGSAQINSGMASSYGSHAKICQPFFPSHNYLGGVTGASLALGDFNHDGILDLVTDDWFTGNLDVLLGKKDGSFQQAGSFPTGAKLPRELAVGDFNNDGKLDVVIVDDEGPVELLLGKGDGTFQAPQATTIGVGTYYVAIGDFNHDGNLDVAAATGNDLAVEVYLGNGDGTFQPPSGYSVDKAASSIAVADFNGDGRLDLAVAISGGYNDPGQVVSVFIGNGDGTFRKKVDYQVDLQPIGITAADFNGDGKIDLATSNGVNGTVSVLINKGNGTFHAARNYAVAPPGGTIFLIAAVQFESDTKPGLIVSSIVATYILSNRGDGTFQVAREYDPPSYQVVVGDFNQDGKTDFAMVSAWLDQGPEGVTVIYGEGHGTFATSLASAAMGDLSGVAAGDFNGDGIPDLAVTGDGQVAIMLGRGDGRFSAPSYYYNVGGFAVAVGDFNRDGYLDIAALNGASSEVSILLGNGDGTFRAGKVYTLTGNYSQSIAFADFRHNGILDMVVTSDLAVSVLLGNGDGTFKPASTYTGYSNVAIADFNGDGKLDFAAPFYGSNAVWLYLGKGDGSFSKPVVAGRMPYPTNVAAADFNHDGKTDLAVAFFTGKQYEAKILLGKGDGTFRAGSTFPTGGGWGVVAADFNMDGRPDLAMGNDGPLEIFLGKGDGTFDSPVLPNIGVGPKELVVANLNGIGAPDLLVPNYWSGEVSVLLGRCPDR
jgi:hypothetical protein